MNSKIIDILNIIYKYIMLIYKSIINKYLK